LSSNPPREESPAARWLRVMLQQAEWVRITTPAGERTETPTAGSSVPRAGRHVREKEIPARVAKPRKD
jgi:hypothetical protein